MLKIGRINPKAKKTSSDNWHTVLDYFEKLSYSFNEFYKHYGRNSKNF